MQPTLSILQDIKQPERRLLQSDISEWKACGERCEKQGFSYDAVTCGLDKGRVDLTRAEYFPTRDATTLLMSSRTIVGRDGGLKPKTKVRTTATPKARLSSSKPTKNKRPTSPSPSLKQPSPSQGRIADPSNLHGKGCTRTR